MLAWDAQADNAVGTEYILMEEASGTPLRKTWESLDLRPKSNVVDELVSISKKLLSVSFTRQVFFSAARKSPSHLLTVRAGMEVSTSQTHLSQAVKLLVSVAI